MDVKSSLSMLENPSIVDFRSLVFPGQDSREVFEDLGEALSDETVLVLVKTIKNITTLIDLQEEDWNLDCEYVIEKFIRQSDFILAIYFDQDDLKASLGFPDCRVTDLHMFYRKKMNVALSIDNFDDVISWSTLDGNPEQTIYAIMTGLQAPMMYTIKHWPNCILQRLYVFVAYATCLCPHARILPPFKTPVYVTRSNGDASYGDRSSRLGNNSSSMFNVSIVSNTGPAKPARTYRSNLARSKSFNVHAGDSYRDASRYTSNPHLSRLDESTELKSPGLITSISRSTRDLTSEDSFRRPLGTYDTNRYTKLNGISSSRTSNIDSHKKIFMKGLMERAPELYKTLHGNDLDENRTVEPVRTSTPLKNGKLEYSTSFRSSNTSSPLDRVTSPYYQYRTDSPDGVNRTVVRRGSNGDYTETVRYTTTSKNPSRPSVTNTVQSVSKKTVPMPGGGEHRIRSTETKTVTKSKFRSGTPELHFDGKYPTSNGGVIIEVRNTRK